MIHPCATPHSTSQPGIQAGSTLWGSGQGVKSPLSLRPHRPQHVPPRQLGTSLSLGRGDTHSTHERQPRTNVDDCGDDAKFSCL